MSSFFAVSKYLVKAKCNNCGEIFSDLFENHFEVGIDERSMWDFFNNFIYDYKSWGKDLTEGQKGILKDYTEDMIKHIASSNVIEIKRKE